MQEQPSKAPGLWVQKVLGNIPTQPPTAPQQPPQPNQSKGNHQKEQNVRTEPKPAQAKLLVEGSTEVVKAAPQQTKVSESVGSRKTRRQAKAQPKGVTPQDLPESSQSPQQKQTPEEVCDTPVLEEKEQTAKTLIQGKKSKRDRTRKWSDGRQWAQKKAAEVGMSKLQHKEEKEREEEEREKEMKKDKEEKVAKEEVTTPILPNVSPEVEEVKTEQVESHQIPTEQAEEVATGFPPAPFVRGGFYYVPGVGMQRTFFL